MRFVYSKGSVTLSSTKKRKTEELYFATLGQKLDFLNSFHPENKERRLTVTVIKLLLNISNFASSLRSFENKTPA